MIVPPLPDLDRPPTRREILKNGAVVHVENRPGERVAVCLTFSTDGVDPGDRRLGLPHLVEHLMMRTDGFAIDRALETAGGFSFARTTRDVVQIVVVTPQGATEGIAAALRLARLGAVTRETVDREARIVGFEGETRTEESREVDRLRLELMPDDGSAFGLPEEWAKVDPARVTGVGIALLKGRAALTVVGPCDPDGTLSFGAERLGAFASVRSAGPKIPLGKRASSERATARTVAGVDGPGGLASLAAALAWSTGPDAWVSFEPRPGAMVITRTRTGGSRPSVADARARLASWHAARLADPIEAALTRGAWAVARPGLNFDRVLDEAPPSNAAIEREIVAWSW